VGQVLRIGVAGLGGMGWVHARNALRLEQGRLVAVASTRAEQAAAAAAELGVRGCTYDELFGSDDVDAVVLAARSIDHAQHACAVLSAGKHLFLEKPGATTLAGQDAVRAAARSQSECVVQIGYHRRYDSRWVKAHRLVAEGAIGRPLLVLGAARDAWASEPEDPLTAGGFLVDMASHDYDAACWFLAQEPTTAYAARQSLVYPELEALGDLDNASVTIRFAEGGIAALHISRTCPWGHDVRVEVVGDEGSIFIGNAASRDGVTVVRRADGTSFAQDYRELFADAYAAELVAFAAACTADGPPGPDLEDDRRAVAIGVAARASAVSGHLLEVGPDWPWN
jgi:predicted dehydrogenase